jgi:LacI family transcriptional regulator
MVTLADVAAHAGVSLATASRALHGTRKVREELRLKVEASAAELGFRANASAQALASGVGNVIGLIVRDLTDPYFATIADGAMLAADRHGLIVTVGTTRGDPAREIALVAALRGQRVRAIVLAGSRSVDQDVRLKAELDGFQASGGAIATVGQDLLGVHTVAPENRAGAAALALALADLGHERFAILAGPRELLTAVDRASGFAEALAARGLTAPVVIHGAFDRDGGFAAASEVDGSAVTCVFAVNDVMAVGALAAFRDRGIVVPRDLSVAGFDDIPTLRDHVPALTTVRLPLSDLGERALELALSGSAHTVEHIPAEVVIRDSTRPLR